MTPSCKTGSCPAPRAPGSSTLIELKKPAARKIVSYKSLDGKTSALFQTAVYKSPGKYTRRESFRMQSGFPRAAHKAPEPRKESLDDNNMGLSADDLKQINSELELIVKDGFVLSLPSSAMKKLLDKIKALSHEQQVPKLKAILKKLKACESMSDQTLERLIQELIEGKQMPELFAVAPVSKSEPSAEAA